MNSTVLHVTLSLTKGLDIIRLGDKETTISNSLMVTYYDGHTQQLDGDVLNLRHIAKIALMMGATTNTKIKYETI